MGKTIKVTANFKAPKGKNYDKTQLAAGKKVEKEHTNNKKVQKIIAKNHLDEDKKYYKKLKKVEKKK
jgi:hypothetical protein